MRFCTYNTRGLGNFRKRKQLFTLIKLKEIDITFLQETHATEDNIHLWRSQWGGRILHSCGVSDARGVIILLRAGLDIEIGDVVRDIHGRYVISEISVEQSKFIICNIYAPNVDSPLFFKEVEAHLEMYENANIIYGGDFNFVINSELDRKFSHCNNDRAKEAFLSFADEKELMDVWRSLNPEAKQYSCCRPNSDSDDWYKFSRLDMFFVSQGLFGSISKSVMQAGFQSDHSFVIFDIDLRQKKRGPGYWKFNNSYLREKEFLDAANALLDEQLDWGYNSLNPHLKWDAIKGCLIQFSKRYGADRARARNSKLKEIEQQIDISKILIEELPEPNPDIQSSHQILLEQRAHMIKNKVEGILIRNKERFYDEGERSSKYYFSLEKHKARKKIMHRIRKENGFFTTDQREILDYQAKYFRKLYKI